MVPAGILHQHVGAADQPGQHVAAGVALDIDDSERCRGSTK